MNINTLLPLIWNHLDLICQVGIPLLAFVVCFIVGCIMHHRRGGLRTGIIVAVVLALLYLYGSQIGFAQIEVTNVEYASCDLPQAFDGYRIVQFSDAHVGTFSGRRADILRRAIDSINAQQADAVVFTGDLQNRSYKEIEQHFDELSKVKAKDGVFAVQGNHDYAIYMNQDDPHALAIQLGRTESLFEELGWCLLSNTRQHIRRDSSTIVIAGMANDGEGRFPQLGNHNQALWGISRDEFVVMLEHDPSSWRRRILPHTHVQLTLSGHTHGGQINILGWSPARLRCRECQGLYQGGGRALYVSRGIGGVVPFRLNCPAEITVITLRKK